MGLLGKIFTWWDGATVGTLVASRGAARVGSDHQGNVYYRARRPHPDGRERRFVLYNGANDASRVPAEWHGWLHGTLDGLPESNLPPPRVWEVEFTPNETGTTAAYRPAGALEKGGVRARATGDYEAWQPES